MAAAAPKLRLAGPFSAVPAPPVRGYSFTNWQTNNPTAPPPGDKLDGEFDRANTAITATINWAETSLNTDGTLKAASVGESQLAPGLFDSIGSDAAADVQPLVDQATASAGQAVSSASAAASSATSAANQNISAQAAATTATAQASAAQTSASHALTSENNAQSSANFALNSANHADSEAALCVDYGVLTQAWAEHMPDTIPPNILAVMDVTGDHWSSRWWANQAHLIVQNEGAEVICDLQHYWMGAYSSPPTHNTCGDPVVAGAMFYNMTSQVCQVYDGVSWHNITQLAPGQSNEYLYLPAVPTTVFTGVDYHGNTLALDTVNAQVGVYLNGVRLLKGVDYSITATSVTLLLGPVTAPNSVEIISLMDVTAGGGAAPSGVKINTNIWVFDGVTKTFPLQNSTGGTINPPGAVDCLVSLNGVVQEAGGDFTTRPGFIDFIVAPEADADKWMVVGVPLGSVGLAAAAGPAGPAGRRGRVGRTGPAGDDDEELLERIELLEARVAALEARGTRH